MVKEILSAIKGACEACVRQEKEERDGIRAQIQQAKVRARADKLPVYHDKRHEERERERYHVYLWSQFVAHCFLLGSGRRHPPLNNGETGDHVPSARLSTLSKVYLIVGRSLVRVSRLCSYGGETHSVYRYSRLGRPYVGNCNSRAVANIAPKGWLIEPPMPQQQSRCFDTNT